MIPLALPAIISNGGVPAGRNILTFLGPQGVAGAYTSSIDDCQVIHEDSGFVRGGSNWQIDADGYAYNDLDSYNPLCGVNGNTIAKQTDIRLYKFRISRVAHARIDNAGVYMLFNRVDASNLWQARLWKNHPNWQLDLLEYTAAVATIRGSTNFIELNNPEPAMHMDVHVYDAGDDVIFAGYRWEDSAPVSNRLAADFTYSVGSRPNKTGTYSSLNLFNTPQDPVKFISFEILDI